MAGGLIVRLTRADAGAALTQRLGELELATDQRHLEVAKQRLRLRQYLHQSERSHRLRLALQREGLDGVCSHSVGDDPVGGLSDEYLARLRRALQPGGNIDRVTEGERSGRIGVANDDLTGIDARARSQPEAEVTLEFSFSVSSPSRISAAARTARSASSS